jgi:HAD superfamily hydrolase (TIGR01509 family)
MAKHVRAIIWDIGLVVLFWNQSLDWLDFWKRVPRLHFHFQSHDDRETNAAILEAQRRLEAGEITTNEHRLLMSSIFGLGDSPLDWEEYKIGSVESEDYSLNRPLLEAQAAIAETPVRQGLVSNLWPAMRDILRHAGALRCLNDQRYSFEEKLMKPSEELLHTALEALGCVPGETLVVDDKEENCVAASHIGCHAHCFTSNHRLHQTLRFSGIEAEAIQPLTQGDRYTPMPTRCWRPPST